MQKSPTSALYGDIYFVSDDGIQEKRLVFVEGNELVDRFSEARDLVVAELGFGLGQAFCATMDAFAAGSPAGRLTYYSIEAHPVPRAEIESFIPGRPWRQEFVSAFETFSSERRDISLELFGGRCKLNLLFGEVGQALSKIPRGVDAWYLDGFAPSKNPEMWSRELARLCAELSSPAATFATYSVARTVRENFAAEGFQVEKRTGTGRKGNWLKGRLQESSVARDPHRLHDR